MASGRREPLRVLHLIKSLGRGGAEMLLAEGLRFGDRDRFDYRYGYFLPWKDAMVPALLEQGVEVDCFERRNNVQILLSVYSLVAYLRRHRIDVMHCHLPVAGAVGRAAGRIAGVPVVYSEHNKQERYHPLTRRLNRLTWGWQTRAIAVSGDVADSIRAHLPASVPVEVVLNGVNLERFSRQQSSAEALRERYGIAPDAPIIGTVAVFRTQKRLQDWLEAARIISEQDSRVRFLLVGDGPLREEITSAIDAKGLDEVVKLPGLLEDVRPHLAAMDVYMMSSIFEGLPVALLEAMSMECVPVCTSVGGIPEVIRSGENGVLVPPEDPSALAHAALEVLSQPLRLRALSGRARKTVAEEFSLQRMVRQLEEIYSDVVRKA